ncbi:anthranilate synthase component II [Anditalea andensis]|uniref:Para-aminobenzoate synthase n=1 Tax=Anditalea andensis TaxID=1048983 RepID=A0A074KWS6_9BACT|nr:aminodeoxychorismate/anthranilate synthase component II [Anditalea andensis]KEO73414.1 para-aminobenzoate synthase [Anditalea andensis]
MLLLIDNFDSFSHMLADYLRQAGAHLKIVRNDVLLSDLIEQEYEGIILSPGPEVPGKAGNLMHILSYYHDKLPVLGICLGHQAIGEFFGAALVRGEKPVHGKVHRVNKTMEHPVLQGLPANFKVTRYHSLELRNLPDVLEVILETDNKEIMGIVHSYLPVVGIQFHPEAYLTEYGLELITNWVNSYIKQSEVAYIPAKKVNIAL